MVSYLPEFLILFFLILFSALVSGSEVAFFSINPKVIGKLNKKDKKDLLKIEKLLKRPKRLLATILVTNNFINIAVVLLFSSLSEIFFKGIENHSLKIIIEVGLITSIILFFGEILPKIYAKRNSFKFSKLLVKPISFIDNYIIFWITIPMSKTTSFFESKLEQKGNNLSVDKLSQALELTSENETSYDEQKILEGIINFGNTDSKEVMCPRIDLFALSELISMKEIIPKIIEMGFSRIPVFKDSIDKITGILYVKDLLPHINKKNFEWNKILKEPFYVPENKKLDDLLKEFQQKKTHMAIVVDEYGGTSGVITLEDIIEEIVGDISDEFDEEFLNYSKLDDKTYLFDSKINLKDFCRIININEFEYFDNIKGDSESLGGLLLEIVKKFPRKGEKINYKKMQFIIEEINSKRIKRVKVKLLK
jgi:gliding motility-associated protein GldE